jgi:hypothetical protein
MNRRLRTSSAMLALVVAGLGKGAPAQVVRRSGCGPAVVAPSKLLVSVDSGRLHTAARILQTWPGDVDINGTSPDHHVMMMLRDSIGGSTQQVLLGLMLNTPVIWEPRTFSLESAAAHFYVEMQFSSEPLEGYLGDEERLSEKGIDALYRTISRIESRSHTVSEVRRHFVCSLAERVVADSGNSAHAELMRSVIWLLQDEQSQGSERASDVLRSDAVTVAQRVLLSKGLLRQ